ncbi:MAG: hypothetical protein LKH26_02160 [Lactobacillus sp.]|jgi:ppGpp synthetase/RelA/SpoT-type nucleotidyltranferase|nr:hypothetical protein [Lactobacillus sp.]MCI1481082.1 hypothetical protein [Lactobacillus sp.]
MGTYDICKQHQNFSEYFYQLDFLRNYQLRNLNKISVSTALQDDFFIQKFLPEYHKELLKFGLDEYLFELNLRLRQLNLGTIRSRAKDPETIIKKMQQYAAREQKIHGLPISKCLNDLQGMRLIAPNVNNNWPNIDKLLQSCHDKKQIKRFYYRDQDNYKSFQCYIQCDNKYLPWELQIWDSADELTNNLAHVKHEQLREYDRRGI